MGGTAIKRPMFICTLAFVLGEMVAEADAVPLFVPALISAAVLILIKVIAKPGTGLIVMAFILFMTGCCLLDGENKVAEQLCAAAGGDGADGTVTGRVESISETEYGVSLFLADAVVCCNDESIKCDAFVLQTDIVCESTDKNIIAGGNVTATGTVRCFSAAANPGNFDRKQYYKSLGYYAYMDVADMYISGGCDVLRAFLRRLQQLSSECIDDICGSRDAGLFKAMLLGDKSDINEEIKSLYRESGIGHLLVISGLHISIVGMFVYRLLRKRFLFVTSGCISLCFVVMFGIMTGAGISTVRAVIMFCIKLLADITGRKYDMLSAASAAALIILLDNPFAIYNAAFQMSFAAVIGAGAIAGILNNFIRIKHKPSRCAVQGIVFGLSINLAVTPITAYCYFELPTYSILINNVVIPLMSVALISGAAGVVSGLVFNPVLGRIMITPGCVVLTAYEKLCTFMEKIPYSNIVVGRPHFIKIAIYYTALACFLTAIYIITVIRERREVIKERYICEHYPEEGFVYMGRDRRDEPALYVLRRVSMVLICVTCLLSIFYIHGYNGLYITFINVGQGDGIFIRNGAGNTYMIDGGSSSVENVAKYRIVPYVKSVGAGGIDYVFITHADSDHINGIADMMESGDIYVGNIIMPYVARPTEAYTEFADAAADAGVNVTYIKSGDVISESSGGENLIIKCIYPVENMEFDDENDYSLVLSITYGNFSGLFTGDIGAEFEQYFTKSMSGNYTLLKVAHHGSKYSTSDSFLDSSNPLMSVISCGKNNIYGHPHEELLERLVNSGTSVYRTDVYGAILVRTDGRRVWTEF